MRGHGGQHIHINIEKGSMLLFHAIAKDFNEKSEKENFIELINFFIFLITFCPGKIGIFLRKIFLKIMFKELGKNFYSEIGLFITGHENITIKNNCRFMRYSSINADKNSSIKR